MAYEWRMNGVRVAYECLRVPTSAYEYVRAPSTRPLIACFIRAPITRLPERFFVFAHDDL